MVKAVLPPSEADELPPPPHAARLAACRREKAPARPNYLNQLFRDKFGVSPKQYLTRLKLDKAKNLLSSTDLPVVMIAASLGFPDQLSFSRAFKGKVGMPPTAYRKSSRKFTI